MQLCVKVNTVVCIRADMGNRDRDDTGRYADGIDPDTVLDVFEARDDRARPITASDVVDELGIARRTAHNKLEILVERGEIETRKIGARGRVWWTPIPDDGDTLATDELQGNPDNTIDELADASDGRESAETPPTSRDDQTVGPTDTDATTPNDAAGETADEFTDVVERVAQSWEDTDARLKARKDAAVAVLEYAAEHGGISKQEAKETVYPEYPVEGQNPRTWYRKNIRPVLNEAAEYNQSTKKYHVPESS